MGCQCTKEQVIANNQKFSICQKIADGGFGTVYLVEDTKYKQFALKKIKCDNKSELESISKENKYYRQLNSHPNLIKLIYDDIVDDKKTSGFIVLSIFTYYSNGTLQEELENNLKQAKHINNDRLINLFYGICDGLSHIHESNLAHRDLKPHNVLISNDGRIPILTDYGSMTDRIIEIKTSKTCQEIQDWAAQNCSMFYKAPELFNPRVGICIDEHADYWSLGCILYALMFNKGPFDYVAEKGDSIALAVANVKYFINSEQSKLRPEYMTNILKSTLLYESLERKNLKDIMNDLKQNSNNIIEYKNMNV